MRILVISDTHGELRPLRSLPTDPPFDYLIHAGDFHADLDGCAELAGVPPARCHGVVGNCDFPVVHPGEAVLNLEGTRILVTHGHQYGIKRNYQALLYRAAELGCRIVIFGHTHVPLCVEERGVLLFNPGSPGRPRLAGQPGTYGVLTCSAGVVVGEHIKLQAR